MDEYHATALHDAARQGNLPMVRALLEHRPTRADVRARDDLGSTALGYAVASGSRGVVAELLDAGAQANEPKKDNETPLLLAVRRGLLFVIEELLAQWANVNVENADGTPLVIIAAQYPNERIAVRMLQLLLSKNPLPTENLVQGIYTLQSRPYVAALLVDYLRKHNILIREPDWLIRWRWLHQGIAPSWSLVLDPVPRSS